MGVGIGAGIGIHYAISKSATENNMLANSSTKLPLNYTEPAEEWSTIGNVLEDEVSLMHNSSTSIFSACYPPPTEYNPLKTQDGSNTVPQKRYINWEWPLRKIWGDRGKNCFKMPTASEITSSFTSVEMFSFLQSEALARCKETYVPSGLEESFVTLNDPIFRSCMENHKKKTIKELYNLIFSLEWSLNDFPKGLSVDLDETDDLVDTNADEIANEIFRTLFFPLKENPSNGKDSIVICDIPNLIITCDRWYKHCTVAAIDDKTGVKDIIQILNDNPRLKNLLTLTLDGFRFSSSNYGKFIEISNLDSMYDLTIIFTNCHFELKGIGEGFTSPVKNNLFFQHSTLSIIFKMFIKRYMNSIIQLKFFYSNSYIANSSI